MRQLPLLADVERVDRPWKVVRAVSKAVYAELRKGGIVGAMTLKVLTALAWYRNQYQEWPTASELTRFLYTRKRIKREDSRLVAPRLTEMIRGRVERLEDGSRVRKGGGVLWLLPARKCRVTGASAHPVAIREAGSSAQVAA